MQNINKVKKHEKNASIILENGENNKPGNFI